MFYRNQLLDMETMVKVIHAAPRPTDYPPNEARMLINALKRQTNGKVKYGTDEQPYYECLLGDLRPDLPETLTPKRAGSMCRMMGLYLRRITEGYLVAWTEEQLRILSEFFGCQVIG